MCEYNEFYIGQVHTELLEGSTIKLRIGLFPIPIFMLHFLVTLTVMHLFF